MQIKKFEELKLAALEDKIFDLKQSKSETSEFKRFGFRKLSTVIVRSIKLLSYELNVRQVLVARAAVDYGKLRFWGFDEIEKIKNAYSAVYRADKDKLRHLKMGEFDLGTSEGEARDYTFRKETISEVTGLAEKLGIPAGTVFQLTMCAGLIEADIIDNEDCNTMVETLKRFYERLKSHTDFVLEIQKQCEEKAKGKIGQTEPKRLGWKDITV